MKIKDHTFIVTGGASGLGEATSKHLSTQGANVVILDMNQEKGEQLVKELGPSRTLFCNTDITSEDSVKKAIKDTITKFKAIHGVVNCAGIAVAMRTVTSRAVFPLDVFNKVLQVNLVGTFNVIRLVADQTKSQALTESGERCVFIMTASVAAYDGQQGQSAYSASKGGIVGMTLPLAREFASLSMRIMSIAPGTFWTPMVAMLPEDATKKIAENIPFPRRMGKPEEFAFLVQHILENTYLNGDTIRLDGSVRLPLLPSKY
ncbi:3-hydroxyacyl-CoA dehydrogenase type II [Tieghemostelium lacteum]|uniref:3-hydroxyacyl-CoA dehydrogenase type-2 n=1 Tax=Tieghemostelium lacteum TaxID=361077 RepID=A0A152A3Q1_TIELA|nr:3-hydroxyacyl-CoA dehydrogenase type II [Tieghemostelium lacteum]|eukprot:KYR00892.1 3-hydroxyacyl-CoA dehydrogenase type II [Tieghemostelium lacteum]